MFPDLLVFAEGGRRLLVHRGSRDGRIGERDRSARRVGRVQQAQGAAASLRSAGVRRCRASVSAPNTRSSSPSCGLTRRRSIRCASRWCTATGCAGARKIRRRPPKPAPPLREARGVPRMVEGRRPSPPDSEAGRQEAGRQAKPAPRQTGQTQSQGKPRRLKSRPSRRPRRSRRKRAKKRR